MAAVISSPPDSSLSNRAAAAEEASGYFASEPHYLSVAGRVLAALGGKGGFVLVTGDPPADPQLLSQALRKVAGLRYRVIGIPCGPELTGEKVSHAGSVVATLPAGGGTATISDTAETDAPLFVFDEAERLSDQQLDQICATMRRGERQRTAGVLLARRGFLARVEQPSLQALKEALAARLPFDEIGDGEGIEFLRHQLAVRHSQDDTRRSRPIFVWSLAVLGVLAAIGVGAFVALHYVRMPDVKTADERSVSPGGKASPGVASLQTAPGAPPSAAGLPLTPEPPKPQAAPAVPKPAPSPPGRTPEPSASVTTPAAPRAAATPQAAPAVPTPAPSPPGRTPEPSASVTTPAAPEAAATPQAPPPPVQSPAGQHPSPAELAALVTRGDAFLSAGDIASARLFYERAADSGNGAAALRLGATFDPNFLGRAGVRGNRGDPAQAAAWYRRARDLGDAAAADRLKNLERQPR
jgi:hypothetical protein